MQQYDYVIVGAGLFGATFAQLAKAHGKKVLVLEKRNHIAGNAYTEKLDDVIIHKYGAHIFHTNDKMVWDYVNSFVDFNNFINSPLAVSNNQIYNLPFNMNTFSKIWSAVKYPQDALIHIEEEKKEIKVVPKNLEEQAIFLVGRTIYETLIKEYTEKQWGKDCKRLPASIIKRLPVRFTYNNNYFDDKYQGIPVDGYTKLVDKMLDGVEIKLNCDFLKNKEYYTSLAKKIVYTGAIDEFFDYCFGKLEYRTLKFETKVMDCENYQGNAVINYIDKKFDYTRVIEHKHFNVNNNSKKTIITYEYPVKYIDGMEKYYVINDKKNNSLLEKYNSLAKKQSKVIFGGRLAEYKYYDMDEVIKNAMDLFEVEYGKEK